jgi:hypothetical protein
MVKIRKFPPGKAIGADDLQIWARQRNGGLSGVPDDRELLHKQRPRERWSRSPRNIARDPWFSRLIAAGCKLDSESMQLAVHFLEMLIGHRLHKTNGPSGE